MELGDTLRKAREERGLTLQAVAEKAELSVSYLSEIEQNKKRPSLKAARRLADALVIPLASLLPPRDGGSAAGDERSALSLGDRLRLAREARDLTLEDAAALAKISTSYLCQIELNQASPSVVTLKRLAQALDVSVTQLIPQERDNLGLKIKDLRDNLGLSRAEVAARAGVSVSLISQLENGRTQPSLDTLQRLANVLGISPCYLIVENPGLEQLMAAMNPEIRGLLTNPEVVRVLRMVCTLTEKEFQFVLKMIQTLKAAGFQ